jgi:hypothetical protein
MSAQGRSREALIAGAVMAAILSIVGAAQAPADVPSAAGSFALGVLRRDGIVIPFATFDGRRWRHDWPPPRESVEVPAALRDVPGRWWGPLGPMETWQAWIGAAAPRALRVRQPDWFAAHCYQQVGLRTDYWPSERPPGSDAQPYPKDGLAVSPAQRVESIAVVEPASDEARSLLPAVTAAFNRAERETEDRFGHPIARRAREGVEPAIEAVYALGGFPRVYYVESVRSYRRLGQRADECTGVAFGTGWFIREGESVRSLEMAVDVLPCNRYGASYMLPLGAMRIGDRLFWLAQFSGWDHERFAVIEIKSTGAKPVQAIVNVWGGGC